MNKKFLLIIVCVIVIIVGLYFALSLNNDDTDSSNEDNGDETNSDPDNIDLSLSMSSDKDEYVSGEQINISFDITNNMDVNFPYGDYVFELWLIDKASYESGLYTPYNIAEDLTSSIELESGSKYSYFIPFNTSIIVPGDYYIVFVTETTYDENYVEADKLGELEIKII